MELYSGQGKVWLAKRNADGTKQRRFFVGNCPKFWASFLTGEVKITTDELKDESLEIICGSAIKQTQVEVNWHHDQPFTENASEFEIRDSVPFEYELTFEGVNTAMSSARGGMRQWRIQLDRVTFTASEGWDFINDHFAEVTVSGVAHKNEQLGNRRGVVHRIHHESTTGMRSQDLRTDAVTV